MREPAKLLIEQASMDKHRLRAEGCTLSAFVVSPEGAGVIRRELGCPFLPETMWGLPVQVEPQISRPYRFRGSRP